MRPEQRRSAGRFGNKTAQGEAGALGIAYFVQKLPRTPTESQTGRDYLETRWPERDWGSRMTANGAWHARREGGDEAHTSCSWACVSEGRGGVISESETGITKDDDGYKRRS
ncbi:hypothetical protein IF1G_00796 [Cordyceps javanica]|uniref:Uncharacterized protein n=1 Tax=Cordyceps javanica TaxID=43265 RepID=A0A545VGL2_9HYPO|nr:hypothetical protein IF1G_00796 [Cordyceps javanica]